MGEDELDRIFTHTEIVRNARKNVIGKTYGKKFLRRFSHG
jgi:hypothetical protein